MGAELDRLDIQIESEARRANSQLSSLVGKLERIEGSLSRINAGNLHALSDGIQRFATASAQLSNVKTSDFTRLAKNIDRISALNSGQITGAASSIVTLSRSIESLGGVGGNSEQIVELANGIGRLGGAAVQMAITNMPLLASGLRDLFTTLSLTPTIRNDVISMTRALADLAAQGSSVGTASRSLTRSVNSMGNAAQRNTTKIKSLSSVIGKFYATYFMVIRSGKKLWESIESSMDYVETLNYFDAAFEQIADSAAKAGERSAEEYFASFEAKAKETTSKMTGYNINANGTLSSTGETSLGINPTKLMNYQAMFAQMSNSMGVSAETSVKLSQALTELGGDLASVKNLDFDKVWTDMASGLAGMSRTLDKYGVNIRNVNLQEKLFELGIEEKITNLNQDEKALLRAIILLDRTKYAWGDLADTLNQPANQMRLLQSNMENLGRTIGNLFLPAVSSLLPYINGLAIATQRLFIWLGNLMGIDLSNITSVSAPDFDYGNLLDDTEELEDGLDGASEKAKKLKANLQGFDELNVINTKDDSGSGSGGGLDGGLLDAAFEDALSKYQEVWDKAFAGVENKANGFADRIEKIFDPLKKIFEDLSVGDFFSAGKDTSALVTGIFDFFSDAIDDVDWEGIGNNIGEYLEGLDWTKIILSWTRLKFNIAKAIWELWKGAFDAAPFEVSALSAILVLKLTPLGGMVSAALATELAKALGMEGSFTSVGAVFGKALGGALTKAVSAAGGLKGLMTLDMAALVGETGWASAGLLAGGAVIGGIVASKVGFELGSWIGDLFVEEDLKMSGKEKAQYLMDGFKSGEIWGAFADWWNDTWSKVGDNIGKLGQKVSNSCDETGKKISSFTKDTGTKISNFFKKVDDNRKETAKATADWWVNDVEPKFSKKTWEKYGENIKSGISNKWNNFKTWWNGTGFVNWWKTSVSPYFTKEKWKDFGENAKSSLKSEWNNFTTWWKNTGFYKWWEGVKDGFKKEKWSFDGIKEGLGQAWQNAIEYMKGLWNGFAGWLNEKLNFSWESFSIAGKEIIPAGSLNLGKIPTFATGGYPPEDGFFMANHSELIGSFANGKTAVANNDQIEAGIEAAAYRGMRRALEESRTESSNVTFQVEGDPYKIFKVTRKEAASFHRRTGRPAFD